MPNTAGQADSAACGPLPGAGSLYDLNKGIHRIGHITGRVHAVVH
jgi:hypothetical protein